MEQKNLAKRSKRIKDTEEGKDLLGEQQINPLPTGAEGHGHWKRRKRGGSAAEARQQVV